MNRIFVDVLCKCFADGSLRPVRVAWPDGRSWKITRTFHISELADHEFEGIRYTVLIGSAEKYIYTGWIQRGMLNRRMWRLIHLDKMHFRQRA